LIRGHHEGYVSWEDYERNRRIIAGNANMKGEMVKGSVRNGGGLLAGLLRCGRCGRKLKVLHNGQRGVARSVTPALAQSCFERSPSPSQPR
jgi:hypothetical protein